MEKVNMTTNACVNVLCKMTAGAGVGVAARPPELQNLDTNQDTVSQYVRASARLIWQCDMINDEKRMNMINRDGNDKTA